MTDSGDLGPNHSAEPGSDQFDLDFGARVMEQGGLTSSVLDGSDDSDGSGGQSHVSSVTEDQPPAEDMRPPVDLASIEPFAPRFLRDPTR